MTTDRYLTKTFSLRFENIQEDKTCVLGAKKILLPPILSLSNNILTITDNEQNGETTEYFNIFLYNDTTGAFVTGIRIAAKDITYEEKEYTAGQQMGTLDEEGNFTPLT